MHFSTLLLIVLPVLIISCKESEETVPTAVITGFTPDSGPVGTVVTISGENFGVGSTENIVTFNDVQATIQSSGSNIIVVEVPSGATSGLISLTVSGKLITSSTSFTVTQITIPEIDAISPMMGPVGSTITIRGSGFNEEPSQNIVKIGNVVIPAVTSTANKITVTVTDDVVGGVVTVNSDGHTATGPFFKIGIEALVSLPTDNPSTTGSKGYSIAVDGNDNMYVAGSFSGNFTLAGSTLNGSGLFLAKLDSHSNLLWLKNLDTEAYVSVMLATDNSGNVFIGGEKNSLFVSKMSPDGSLLWKKTFDGDNFSGLDVDPSGDIVFTGMFYNTIKIGSTELTVAGDISDSDILVVKLDSDGTPVWAKNFGGLKLDGGTNISCAPSGDIYVAAVMTGSMEFAGETVASAGDLDGLIFKLNPDGDQLWANTIGGPYMDQVSDIEANGNDGVIVTGTYGIEAAIGGVPVSSVGDRDTDFFVAKYNADGDFSWVNSGGSSKDDRGNDVEISSDGTVVLAAQIKDDVHINGVNLNLDGFGEDSSLILRFNESGIATSGALGGSYHAVIGTLPNNFVALTSDGAAHVVGSFAGKAGKFGSTELTSTIFAFFLWNVQL